MPPLTRLVDGVIFDLDGVLVDSRACVDAVWAAWCSANGIELAAVEAIANGRRGLDVVREVAPHLDAVAEAAALDAHELRLVHRLAIIPGAAELVGKLPVNRWAVATSAAEAVARERLALLGLPIPGVFVAAEMVARGKPDPEVFLRAAAELGFDPRRCAVLEDAPDGIAAANAAGAFAIGVLTWAAPEQLATPFAVRDLRGIDAMIDDDRILLHVSHI